MKRAANAADAAANTAAVAADAAAIWKVLQADLQAFENGQNIAQILAMPLWHGGIPSEIKDHLQALQTELANQDHDWDVWLGWYDHVLLGAKSPKRGIALLSDEQMIELAQKPKEFWEREPEVVNGEIKGMIIFSDVPKQSRSGLEVSWVDKLIRVVKGQTVNPKDGEVERVSDGIPFLKKLTADLLARFEDTDIPRDGLQKALKEYATIVNEEDISVSQLYFASTILRNEYEELQNPNTTTNVYPLDGSDKATMDSLLNLTEVMLLATKGGRTIYDDAETIELTTEEIEKYRELELKLLDAMDADGDLMLPEEIEMLRRALRVGGKGRHPNRTALLSVSTMRNVLLVLIGGGVLGGVGYVVFTAPVVSALVAFLAGVFGREPLKKFKIGSDINDQITNQIDRKSIDFLLKNEDLIRKIVKGRKGYKVFEDWLDWAKKNKIKQDDDEK